MKQLLALMDWAFDGAGWESLVGNLRSTRPDDWEWRPDGGSRSIRDIVRHVGACKLMYENHAFGDATLGWADAIVDGGSFTENLDAAIDWLRDGQKRLRTSIADLSDANLDADVRMNWGEYKPASYLVTVMIHHDVYHAGEINLLRSLHHRDDLWEHER
jgi:uncharacterized damage-inducible protein DinB